MVISVDAIIRNPFDMTQFHIVLEINIRFDTSLSSMITMRCDARLSPLFIDGSHLQENPSEENHRH